MMWIVWGRVHFMGWDVVPCASHQQWCNARRMSWKKPTACCRWRSKNLVWGVCRVKRRQNAVFCRWKFMHADSAGRRRLNFENAVCLSAHWLRYSRCFIRQRSNCWLATDRVLTDHWKINIIKATTNTNTHTPCHLMQTHSHPFFVSLFKCRLYFPLKFTHTHTHTHTKVIRIQKPGSLPHIHRHRPTPTRQTKTWIPSRSAGFQTKSFSRKSSRRAVRLTVFLLQGQRCVPSRDRPQDFPISASLPPGSSLPRRKRGADFWWPF